MVPNGYDVCVRNRYSRDPHEKLRCNVQIGVRPCESFSRPYVGRNCLYIDQPFYHAFVCAKCVNQLHGKEQNVQRCLETEDNSRFSILRTGSGFSISVTRGKGHAAYNTVRTRTSHSTFRGTLILARGIPRRGVLLLRAMLRGSFR